jgi:hypothetical protein
MTWRSPQVYRRDVDLTIEGDTVTAIGPAGPATDADTVEIDAGLRSCPALSMFTRTPRRSRC